MSGRITQTLKHSLTRMKREHGADCKFRWIIGKGVAADILEEYRAIAKAAKQPEPPDVATLWGHPVEVSGPERQIMLIPA